MWQGRLVCSNQSQTCTRSALLYLSGKLFIDDLKAYLNWFRTWGWMRSCVVASNIELSTRDDEAAITDKEINFRRRKLFSAPRRRKRRRWIDVIMQRFVNVKGEADKIIIKLPIRAASQRTSVEPWERTNHALFAHTNLFRINYAIKQKNFFFVCATTTANGFLHHATETVFAVFAFLARPAAVAAFHFLGQCERKIFSTYASTQCLTTHYSENISALLDWAGKRKC